MIPPPPHLNCLKCHLRHLTSFYQMTDEFDWKVQHWQTGKYGTHSYPNYAHLPTRIYIHITIFVVASWYHNSSATHFWVTTHQLRTTILHYKSQWDPMIRKASD